MLQIGITGGIGSGKSLVCEFFTLLGIPVYDADSAAKGLMVSDKTLIDNIKKSFGEESYLPDGTLNRRHLAQHVFNPHNNRVEELNALVHPAVRAHAAEWTTKHEGKAPYVLREAALMFESKSYKDLDKTVLVYAPQALRLERVLKRDTQRSQNEVKAIFEKQMPEEEKKRLADFILINDGERPLIPQMLELHQKFLSMAKSSA